MQLVKQDDIRKSLLEYTKRGFVLQEQVKLMTNEFNLLKVKLLNDLTGLGENELVSDLGKAKIIEKEMGSIDTERLYADFKITPEILEKYKKVNSLKYVQFFPKK